MKKFLYFALAITSMTAFFYACEDDELTPNPLFTGEAPQNGGGGGNSNQFMIATIDGKTINFPISEVDTFGFFGSEWELNGEFGFFSPNPDAGKRFEFEIYEEDWVVKEDTTYFFGAGDYIHAIYTSNTFVIDDSVVFFADTGQIRFTVAKPSGYEGTFSFTATSADDSRTVNITNGSFKAVIDQDQ
jgi:hypothetical protein